MKEHEEKLEAYKKNPYEGDNAGLLKNACSEEVRTKIIRERIDKLGKQIKGFQGQIQEAVDELARRG